MIYFCASQFLIQVYIYLKEFDYNALTYDLRSMFLPCFSSCFPYRKGKNTLFNYCIVQYIGN